MLSKIKKSICHRFTQDHQKLLNQDIIAKYIGMLVIVIITPFAVVELVNARYQFFLIDMIVILVVLQDLVSMRIYAKPIISRYMIVVVFGVVIWLLTYYRGQVGVYWSYPYVMFSHFLLRSRSSTIIISLFLIGMAPLVYHSIEGIQALRVMVTLTTTTIIIWFVSFVVTQQRSSLSDNQEKYKTLVETSLQGILIVSESEKPIFANATMARLLGFDSPEELTSLDSLVSLYHPDESERLTGYTKARLKNEAVPISYEVRWLKKDGTIVWFLANVQNLEWDGEQVVHGVYIDITDRKRVEEDLERHRVSLSQSKKMYETLVETSLQGFLIVNENEKPIFANMAMANMLGFDSPEDLIRLETLELLYHPDESERLIEYTKARLRNEPAPKIYEVKWCRKDGSTVWLLANVQVLEWNGERVAQALYLDITERKRAAEKLRKSEESLNMAQKIANIGSWDWNIQNETQNWSDQTYTNFGLKPGEVIPTYDTFKKFIHPDDRKFVEYALEKALKGDDPYSVEARMINADGTEWIMRAQGFVYRDDKGNPIRIIGTQQDITEKRQMEEALRRVQKMDAIGQLTGGIAHDFNNILGVILGNLSLLKVEVSAESKAPKRVLAIEKAAQRAAGLIRQLLGISRKKGVDVCFTDINVLIQNMDNLISRSITPEVEVEKRLSENLWLTEIDRSDFEDTLLNLVLNARDAMPNDGRLTIETRNCVLDTAYCAQNPEATPGEYVQLSLSDTGTGISDEEQEHIFEPFFTTKPVGKGTGLGLSMVFGFINRSQGYIEVCSRPGIGATFNLYLPRARAKQQYNDITDRQADEMLKGDELILVVDDEPGLLELAQDSLSSQGYRVLIASNGKQALELLVNNPGISLLFSDIVMPGGMSGYDLAERASAVHPDLKVLLTSGHTEKEGHHVRGKYNLLKKPYSHEALAYQVRSFLDE